MIVTTDNHRYYGNYAHLIWQVQTLVVGTSHYIRGDAVFVLDLMTADPSEQGNKDMHVYYTE